MKRRNFLLGFVSLPALAVPVAAHAAPTQTVPIMIHCKDGIHVVQVEVGRNITFIKIDVPMISLEQISTIHVSHAETRST